MTGMSRILVIFGMGLVVGWFLYPVINEPLSQTASTVVTPPSESAPPTPSVATTEQGNSDGEASDNEPESQSTVELLSLPQQILIGDYHQAVSDCLTEIQYQEKELCRQQILETLTLIDSKSVRKVLEIWLEQVPQDMEIGFHLAKVLHSDGESEQAIRVLHGLEAHRQEVSSDTNRPREEVERIAKIAMTELVAQKDARRLLRLSLLLIGLDPDNAAWRYKLAKLQNDLKQYANAINTMGQIFDDPDYGEPAEALYENAIRQIDLSQFEGIALLPVGSSAAIVAMLNEEHAVRLLVDPRASFTSVKPAVLAQHGLSVDADETVSVTTANGPIQSAVVVLDALSAGGQAVRNIEIAAPPLEDIDADGLLGINFLENFRFIIDRNQGLLLLSPR